MKYDQDATNAALRKVAEKHPHAVIVTGDGRGAEKHVAEFAGLLGLEVARAALHPEWFGKDALICQVDSILIETGPVILVGSGERVKRAEDWLKRCDAWRDHPRPVWRIRDEKPKKPPAKRARKKTAVEA